MSDAPMTAELRNESPARPTFTAAKVNIDRAEIAAGVRNGLIQFVLICAVIAGICFAAKSIYDDVISARDRQFEREKADPSLRDRDAYSTP